MSDNNDEKKSEVGQERSEEQTVLSLHTRSITPYLKTLPNGNQDGQGSGNHPDGVSGKSGGSQESEKDTGNKS